MENGSGGQTGWATVGASGFPRPIQLLDLDLAERDAGIPPTRQADRSSGQLVVSLAFNDIYPPDNYGNSVDVRDHLNEEPLPCLGRDDGLRVGGEYLSSK